MPAARAWVLWAVHLDYITDPEILRPLESFSTRRECEIYRSAFAKVQLERFDKLRRENQQRATEGGEVVKGLRDKRGWTQEELAERAGVTKEIVSKVESGTLYSLSLSVAFDLSKALGVMNELGQWSPHMPRNTITDTKCWPDNIDPRGAEGSLTARPYDGR